MSLYGGVFLWRELLIQIEIKNKAIKMKIEGYNTKEIMDELNVRNKTQIETWNGIEMVKPIGFINK